MIMADDPTYRRIWEADDGEDNLALCHNDSHGWFWLTNHETRQDMTPEDLHDLAATILRKVPKP